ncbi:SPOR domain-containing protein [Brumimicrobium aurantiacum]|uniref:SPOR domain-containing protein n=1 Tax=Brumimicrobium aurantiacum TaxID=1737063 RepID=A0A3E1EZL1_9FLAO|nr:SPOR domain-containing protein [Brumimicrobium aurantiacum]RFC54994.1 hypothetical protein DXU93_04005 [Brumimicrobium aurantiacum]
MDQYIKQLLLLHSKVILPQFGAIFIANEETGDLSFNEYLSYDDGKLAKLLEEESNMDLQEAQNSVAKFVRDLELQLNKGETYSIFQLGEFSKDNDGSYIFKGNIKNNQTQEAISGPSPTPIAEEKTDSKEKTEDIPTKEESAPVEPKKEEIKKEQKKESVEKAESVKPKPTPTVQEKKTKKEPEVKQNVYVEKSAADSKSKKKEVAEPKTTYIEKDNKRKKGFLFWFLLIFLLLVISGSVYVGLNYDKVEEYMGWTLFDENGKKVNQKNENESEAIPSKDENISAVTEENNVEDTVSTSKEEVSPEEQKSEPEPEEEEFTTPVEVAPSSGNYRIIIGCFGDKSNADQLVNKYRAKGYDAKIIKVEGGLHFVSAHSYDNYSKAKSVLETIKQSIDGAWLEKI